MNSHEIKSVAPGSIADELGLEAGDKLVSIDGERICDILDYRFKVQSEHIVLEVEKRWGRTGARGYVRRTKRTFANTTEIHKIAKDPDEDLGLYFVQPLMSPSRVCCNKCVFCFVDQQPPGLRDSLYVKDDDARLSFLMGNYVTLTNLSAAEVRRLANYHLSPLRMSVHAADLDLRCKMMGTKKAENLFVALEEFNRAGITMHFQIVLCKGLNDGHHLDYTIERLAALQPGAASLTVVPAGLTKHRQGLFLLQPFSREDAAAVVSQVEAWQFRFKKERGSSFVFLSDEWYVLLGQNLPDYAHYEDFPQLDNGVGMLALFEHEFNRAYLRSSGSGAARMGIVTGRAAADFMQRLARNFEVKHPNTKITIYAIDNEFFGSGVTVSGLLTGADITRQLQCKLENIDALLLPQNAFRFGTEDMLDGITRGQLAATLGVPVHIGDSDGGVFYEQLKSLARG